MSKLKLNAIATLALVDQDFKAAMLSGRLQEKLSAFQLNEEEMRAVTAIQAMDLDQFMHRLGTLIQAAPAVH
ncbi:MAG: hypothetical protein KF821_10725 [Anaerolineales bacterium]|jgi:hypothetical protein|nr:hypothetical protein [Anaerolineales bacterium]MBX3006285.1 hypothetical protein [Anaerolineales bacterium]MCW5839033.1 hypothetical protein [Anaerolineales bacterium]MCW5888467.1 hypothetical protein [Anaerolineales bacterium]